MIQFYIIIQLEMENAKLLMEQESVHYSQVKKVEKDSLILVFVLTY